MHDRVVQRGGVWTTTQIHNSGDVRAYDLSVSFPTMGVVCSQAHLEHGDWARPPIAIADDAPIRTSELSDPVATLTYKDRFGHPYTLKISLTQQRRDDGRFSLGSRPGGDVVRPDLTARQLWRLRKEV